MVYNPFQKSLVFIFACEKNHAALTFIFNCGDQQFSLVYLMIESMMVYTRVSR